MSEGGTNGNGRIAFFFAIGSTIAALAGPAFILIAGVNEKTNKLDEMLQREMRLVSGQVDERVIALKEELERQIASNRELREEQVGELKRRLISIEQPTNSTRTEQLDDLRRRLDLVETMLRAAKQ